MILEKGNMWDVFGKTGLFLITTNPITRKDGALVMGRGIALEAAKRFPELPFLFGEKVTVDRHTQAYDDPMYPVYCSYVCHMDGQAMGYFMVKDHWREPASLEIIAGSVRELSRRFFLKNKRVDLNFPGIGNGRLKREDVLPIIEQLPDNVHVWEFE